MLRNLTYIVIAPHTHFLDIDKRLIAGKRHCCIAYRVLNHRAQGRNTDHSFITGLTAAKLDGADLKTAVAAVDTGIAGLDDAAITNLASLLVTLEARLQDNEDAEASADAALAAAEASPAVIADDLDKALLAREAALRLAAAGNTPAAVRAYVDYQAARARLTSAAAPAAATALQTGWNTARDAQLSAVADLLAAQVAVIQAQLELSRKRATMAARLATRDADAAAAVDAVLNPPAPPGP